MSAVNVIVPCYNSAPYLPRFLASLEAQAFRDVEYLFIDDGSPDNSGEVVERHARQSRLRIRVVRKANGGVASAWNRGVEESTSPLIAFADPDDELYPNYLSTLVETLESTRADIAVAQYARNYEFRRPLLDRLFRFQNDLAGYRGGAAIEDRPEILTNAFIAPWTRLYRREVFANPGVRAPEPSFLYCDLMFFLRIHCQPNLRVASSEEVVYNYRIRKGSYTTTLDERIFDADRMFAEAFAFIRSLGTYELYEKELEFSYVLHAGLGVFIKLLRADGVDHGKGAHLIADKLKARFPRWKANPYLQNSQPLKRAALRLAGSPRLMKAAARAATLFSGAA